MTTEAWVINASPLILYARIDQLVLLEQLSPRLIIPEAVIEEVRSGHHKDHTAGRAVAWATQYRRWVKRVLDATTLEAILADG